MGVVVPPTSLSREALFAFHATDHALSDAPIMVLYGPSSTSQATPGSSRIQCHIFTPAGLQSYPRLAISPSSGLYSAVNQLPRAEQGDEVSRALAYSLFKYFSELPEQVRDGWVRNSLSASKPSSALRLFSDAHAAELTTRMKRMDNPTQVIEALQLAFQSQSVSYLDVDVVLPNGSISADDRSLEQSQDQSESRSYGQYTPLIEALGEWAFLPTSRVRRAPSRATAANRSTVFSRSQKESLRREMCELLDTEERYVAKLHHLIDHVAADFRQKARLRNPSSKSPTEAALQNLFPPSLDEILRINGDFLDAARMTLEETENDAIADIEGTGEDGTMSGTQHSIGDPTGATALARCLINWFPRFSKCYGDYMQAHTEFAHHIKLLLHDGTSSFAKRVQETGEQKLTSLLIEPVQRLPRYSLYIENITRQLPVRHPALKTLLRAKDIIGDICAQDRTGTQTTKTMQRLRALVPTWPSSCRPSCRLVTAVDLVELTPPFTYPGSESRFLIALFFGDILALLERDPMATTSARGLMTELDTPSTQEELNAGNGITFVDVVPLSKVRISELGAGECIQITPVDPSPRLVGQSRRQQSRNAQSLAHAVQVFRLGGAYEGKAARLSKDIAKARVEGRYAESERENPKWAARDTECIDFGLGLFSAVVEESMLSRAPSCTRILVDREKCGGPHIPRTEGPDVVAAVSLEGNGFFRIEVEALHQHATRDLVQAAELMPVLCKRSILTYLLQHNEAILRSLTGPGGKRESRSSSRSVRGPRHHSPVKAAVTSLFGSVRETKPLPPTPSAVGVFSDIVNLRPNFHNRSKSEATGTSGGDNTPSKARLVRESDACPSKLSAQALEQTFDSYILALHARKGNVVGRSVTSRKFADEALVNELYNVLLDEPQNAIAHEQAAQSQVDVLFASFEKFLGNAWMEQMGPMLPLEILTQLQIKAESLSPIDYEEFLQQKIEELTPQNQRALMATIGMLIDLMEGTPNDGDRGALMMAVTEIIVREKNAQDFVPIFDRLVEDYDTLVQSGPQSGRATPVQSSMSSRATRSTQAGSLSSKASSFSKRFGRGILNRQNSKSTDLGARLGSIRSWRTGKSPVGDSPRSALNRARSVDLITQSASSSRPVSRDRPQFLSAFDGSPGLHRPQSGHSKDPGRDVKTNGSLATPKPKRRSSLSDIKSLPAPNLSPLTWTPGALERGDKQNTPKLNTPGSILASRMANVEIPIVAAPLSPREKKCEIVHPLRVNGRPCSRDEDPFVDGTTPLKAILPAKTTTKITILSQSEASAPLPVPRGVLSERPASGNTPPPPQSPPKRSEPDTLRKVRHQSPQKLNDRLKGQHEAVGGLKSGLKTELAKLGEDFAALGWSSANRNNSRSVEPSTSKDQKVVANVTTRLKALESKIPHLVSSLERRQCHQRGAVQQHAARTNQDFQESEGWRGCRCAEGDFTRESK
ncbi:hypothetical protein FH972_024949 [Carpinus fangiana]|uniref:DH domain-containing protein n=1 Tax=Carpinus fangiana TaxID=176857 RepID=A0A5N6KZK6_9ROSI|nr:hypothetical protein FH972_024949 [Carpinus fangiana]